MPATLDGIPSITAPGVQCSLSNSDTALEKQVKGFRTAPGPHAHPQRGEPARLGEQVKLPEFTSTQMEV